MRAPAYRRIQAACIGLLNKYTRYWGFPKAVGACVDCGSTKYLRYDHRSYDEPFEVEVVCASCNALRGAATYSVLDPDTLERAPGAGTGAAA